MANFERKQIPFLHKGQNWNSPPEKLADGVPNWAKNVRVLQQGTISAAHGFTSKFTLPDRDFLHSMSRLNILNETDAEYGGGAPAFDQNLSRTYVLGADYALYVFQDQATLSNSQLNPVLTPTSRTLGPASDFSGNPLSIVDMNPVGAAVAWKYIGDANQMVSVGYYPGDQKGVNMARCNTMGLDPPVFTGGRVEGNGVGTGNLLGDYQWCFVYRNVQTGARSNPSAATRYSAASPSTPLGDSNPNHTPTGGETAALVNIPDAPIDPQTGLPNVNIVVDIYRFGGNIQRWALVASGAAGGSTFYDNTPDENLLAAAAPSQVTDASTGLTRFNLYRPFVTQDIARQGFASLSQDPVTGVMYVIPAAGATPFNPQWLPGSSIYLNNIAFQIYQIWDKNKLELAGDVSAQLSDGATVDWSTPAGTLVAGQPLPHIWGPYGIGQSGSYIFACGDPNGRGTLYWTNGNDPDSTDVVNNIIVTSPSEKLVTGCVYDGQPYVWSTERQFQIFPSLTVFGQFTTQEVAGAKGVWLEWSLSVQSNGIADQSVTWRGKDGIYDMSASAGLQRLTDPLYPFFPHDNQPSIAPETIITQISSISENPEHVGNLDDTQPQYHRITWFQGLLFYDFVALTTNATTGAPENTYSTLVWDGVNIPNGGWVSLDQPFDTIYAPVCRCVEVGANTPGVDDQIEPGPIYGPMERGGNVLVLRSKDPTTSSPETTVYDYYGYTRGFKARVITRAEDIGDSRAPKLFGDFWVDCTPINSITFTPLGDFNVAPLLPSEAVPGTVPGPPDQRQQFVFDFHEFALSGGRGLLTTTLGLDVTWVAADGQFTETINQWQPSYVLKPEFIEFRASDPDDQGATQAKYLMGANIEANTQGIAEILGIIIDDQMIAQLDINHPTQSIKPYAWEPVAGYEFQVRLQLGPGMNALQLFKINWIFEPWPDTVARKYPFTNLGDASDKFIQGIVLPMETGGAPCTVGVWSDDTNLVQQWTKQTLPLKKTGVVLNIEQPFTAHYLQFQTITPGRIWPQEAKVVWEPIPEMSNTWQTQETDFDMGGWSFLRDCFIAYMGGDGSAPTLYITDEYETVAYVLDPVASGQYTRCYRVLKPMKAKWHSFRLEGAGPGVRLYQKDTVFRAKEWGSAGPYVNIQPFGGASRASGARM